MAAERRDPDRLDGTVALRKVHGVASDFNLRGDLIELHAVGEIRAEILDDVVGDPDPARDRVLRVVIAEQVDAVSVRESENQQHADDSVDAIADDLGARGREQRNRRRERSLKVDAFDVRLDRNETQDRYVAAVDRGNVCSDPLADQRHVGVQIDSTADVRIGRAEVERSQVSGRIGRLEKDGPAAIERGLNVVDIERKRTRRIHGRRAGRGRHRVRPRARQGKQRHGEEPLQPAPLTRTHATPPWSKSCPFAAKAIPGENLPKAGPGQVALDNVGVAIVFLSVRVGAHQRYVVNIARRARPSQ